MRARVDFEKLYGRFRFAALALSAAAMFVLGGCDDKKDKEDDEKPEPVKTEPSVAADPKQSTPKSDDTPLFNEELLRKHATYLASDELAGRQPATPGGEAARDYILSQFKGDKLSPDQIFLKEKESSGTALASAFFQSFKFISEVKLGPSNALYAQVTSPKDNQTKFEGALAEKKFSLGPQTGYEAAEGTQNLSYTNKQFVPLRMSPSGHAISNLVFVGYGISAIDKSYDDYAGVDVKDKIVLALRGEPETPEGKRIGTDKPDPHALPGVYADIFYKAAKARDKGAAGLILVTGYRNTNADERVDLFLFERGPGGRSEGGVPVIQVTPAVAEDWFKASGKTLKERQELIDKELKPHSEALDTKIALSVDVQRPELSTENVLAYLPGTDEKLKNELIVIGAHYDHLGHGNEFSLAKKEEFGQIHHGADDNASGDATLLEVARALSKEKLRRTIVFIAFGAEELGCLGSEYLVKHPTQSFDVKHCVAMLNLDMVGRCRDDKLFVAGVASGTGFDKLLEEENKDLGFKLVPSKEGFGGSDHQPFQNAGVPVLFFFTGQHPDYHRPTDTADKLNYADMAKVAKLTVGISKKLAMADEKPAFVKVEAPKMQVSGMGGVRLGTMPDYNFAGKGMRLNGVRGGSAADKAGLKEGDVIVELGGVRVENVYDYMNALRENASKNEIEITVERDGKKVTVKATPERNQ